MPHIEDSKNTVANIANPNLPFTALFHKFTVALNISMQTQILIPLKAYSTIGILVNCWSIVARTEIITIEGVTKPRVAIIPPGIPLSL